MDTSKISAPLLQALLRRKRVLVVVDGVSEMPKEVADLPIRPDKGAVDTRFLVVTSRLPNNLPESLVIRPQGLTIEVLDRVLDQLIAENVGHRRFSDADREALRTRIRSLIKVAGEGAKERQVPMIFIKLMIERADRLLKEGKQLAELPTTLAELVTESTEQLLRNEQDIPLAMHQARATAQVCMGKERSPAARSQSRYTAKGVSREILDKFVIAGLMVRSGEKGDPFYKFALDPIAEQLDANRLLIDIREERADQTEVDELMYRWEELPEDFVSALRRAATSYCQEIGAARSPLLSKLWSNDVGGSSAQEFPVESLRVSEGPQVQVFAAKDPDRGAPLGTPGRVVENPHARDLVYLSFSSSDDMFRNELRAVLLRDIRLQEFVWDDKCLSPGDDYSSEFDKHVTRARIMVMLVSARYLDSKGCQAWKYEIPQAIAAHEKGDLTIMWIPVRAVRASDTPFPTIQSALPLSTPLADMDFDSRQRAYDELR